MPSALIVHGGWEGHEPKQVATIFDRELQAAGFDTTVSDSLDAFKQHDLTKLNLIVPVWTMGTIEKEQLEPVLGAVEGGVGLGGCHGGMCDSFRQSEQWQFMTGGQWVAHPGNDGVKYTVNIKDADHEITRGLGDFEVESEQYYMHVDPAVKVLATTRFPTPGVDGPHTTNDPVDMPQVWTKMYGKGRVFYNALGHVANVFDNEPALELMRRGFQWAARK
jgi:type 1 glutamine amidotransferase